MTWEGRIAYSLAGGLLAAAIFALIEGAAALPLVGGWFGPSLQERLATAERNYVEKRYVDVLRDFRPLADDGAAAERGDPRWQYNLGVMYMRGRGVDGRCGGSCLAAAGQGRRRWRPSRRAFRVAGSLKRRRDRARRGAVRGVSGRAASAGIGGAVG